MTKKPKFKVPQMSDDEQTALSRRLEDWCVYYQKVPFTESLDEIFKVLVPVLQKHGWMLRVQCSPLRHNDTAALLYDWCGYAVVYEVGGSHNLRWFNHEAIAATPALAACIAIDQFRIALDNYQRNDTIEGMPVKEIVQ